MNGKSPVPHTVIRASAGTGKTYQLSSRFIGLLAAGVPPDQILATTFTRKAAGEIQDRVLLWLAQAASDDKACLELAESIGDKAFSRAKAGKLLVKTVRSLHTLRIGTLDSYFLQVAGGFGLELGLPPGWTICDEIADQVIREQAIEEVLARGKLPELLTLMNLLAKGDSVRSISRVVSDTVTSLFGLYRQSEAPAWEQIAIPKGLSVEEFQAVIDQIAEFPMPESRWTKSRDGDLSHAWLENWGDLIAKGLALKVLDGETEYYKKPIPDELTGLYRKLLAHAESVLVGQIAQQTHATHRLLDRFAGHYAAIQHDERALRFDDVTHRLAAAAGVNAPARLAFRLDGVVRHLLLDEFQDTAPVQWQVLRPLARAILQQPGASFFCVGDTKQAIYGWRGGVAEIFDAIDGELPGLACQTLATSYRSSQPVIDAVNQVFQNLAKHPNLDKLQDGVSQWQRQFPVHSTAKADLPGHVRLEFAPRATEGEDQTDTLFDFAAERIANHVSSAPRCSVGVLVRTNAAVARMIYLLRKRNVPASEEGGNPLIDSPAVEIVLSLLTLADHPGDRVARFHLAHSPLATALEVTDYKDEIAAAQCARKLRRDLLDQGYGPVVFAWARRLAEHCDRRDQSRLQQLVELAYEYQPASTLRADDFVSLVQKRRIADPSTAEVRVMTIHQAKGLEFEVVVLPELDGMLTGQPEPVVVGRPQPTEPVNIVCRYANEGVRRFLPTRVQALFEENTRRTVAESLCVLYVAMTRAVHCLHMILTPPAANERNLRKTFAGILRATLGNGLSPTEGVIYEHGEPKWFRKRVDSPAACVTPEGSLVRPIRLAPSLASRERGLERISPSAREGGSRVAASTLLDSAGSAFDYGTLIHAWMQHVRWLDDEAPADEALLAAARKISTSIAEPSQLRSNLATLHRQLAQPNVAAALRRSNYRELTRTGDTLDLYTERAFALRIGDELVAGSIDRLIIIRRGGRAIAADVLDFKTDAVVPSDAASIAARVEFYRPQMETYRDAVVKMFGLEPKHVTARLVFLAGDIVHSLS